MEKQEFAAACAHAPEWNERNCLTILKDNRDTEFGRKYGFADTGSAEEYRKKVPLSDYRDFESYIDRMLSGEEGILTAYPVLGFCHTSGTEGSPKYIPVTRTQMERYGGWLEHYQDELQKEHGGKRLLLNTFRVKPGKPHTGPCLLSEIFYKYLMEQGYLDMETFAGGRALLFEQESEDMMYAKVWVSMLEEGLTLIESIFLYDQLYFFSYMEKNWKSILAHIRGGSIPEEIRLSERVKSRLLKMPSDPRRLEKVETECEKGFRNIAGRLWPGLKLISGISNPAYSSENDAIEKYTGDVSRYYFCYTASECYMGHALRENDYRYVLMPGHAFFEFLPCDDGEGTAETCLPGELKTGRCYEIVITNFSGLYRYRMGDVLRMTGYYGKSPVMEFVCRRNQGLNLAGEKTGIRQIETVFSGLKLHGIVPEQYCLGYSVWEIPARYLAVIQTGPDSGEVSPGEAARLIDESLMENNPDYKDLRRLCYLGEVEAVFLSREEYGRFLEESGLKAGHNKPKHIAEKGFSRELFTGLKRKDM